MAKPVKFTAGKKFTASKSTTKVKAAATDFNFGANTVKKSRSGGPGS